jgi:predicted small secreted protein
MPSPRSEPKPRFPSFDFERNAMMKRSLLAIAAVLALGTIAACASTDTASTRGGGVNSTPSAVDGTYEVPPTLNDSFHYPSSD